MIYDKYMKNKLPSKFLLSISFISLFSLLYLFPPVPAQGDTSSSGLNSTSNCVITKIGNPKGTPALPPPCETNGTESQIVQNVIRLARSRINNKNITYIGGQPIRDWSTENPNTNDPTHFDCSGFVGWAWYWGSNGKVNMLGQTNDDWANEGNRSYYQKVVTSDESQLQPGDAVYFNDHIAAYPQPYHVGLYIGKDPGSTCTADDCFMQFSTTGYPGDEESIKADSGTGPGTIAMMGYIRMKVQ